MKSFYTLILLSLTFCFGQNKIKIETILSEPQKVTISNVDNHTRSHTTYVEKTKRLQPQINITDTDKSLLKFQLQGNINSGGLSINRVKKIRIEEETLNSTLILKCYTEIIRIPGKEGANVKGYNYTKTNSIKIPKNTNKIIIELYHEFKDQNVKKPLALVATEEIDLK